MERLWKTTKNINQYGRYPGRDLSLWPPEYESGVLATRPRRSATVLNSCANTSVSKGLCTWSYLGRENIDTFHLVVTYIFCATVPPYRRTSSSEGFIFEHCYVPLLSVAGTSVILSFNWYFLPTVRRTAPLLQHSNLMESHSPCALISLETTLRAPFTLMQSGRK
jgi:hypothetical protein